jgi:hypothetical protein
LQKSSGQIIRKLAIADIQMFVQHGPNIEGLQHRSFAACPQAAFFCGDAAS